MDNLDTATDEALWGAAAGGDDSAEEAPVERYAQLVRVRARPYFLAGGDSEDLIQEGMIGLLSAIRRYDPGKEVPFRQFAERCIMTRLYTAIRSASRFKHRPLNDCISIESPQFDETHVLSASYLRDPEEMMITRELTDELNSALTEGFSRMERAVLRYYLEGLSYEDIAARAGVTVKSVDNAVQRIRRKLARLL